MSERLPEFQAKIRESDAIPQPFFEGGWVSISQNALAALGIAGEDFRALLERHLTGDWGAVTEEEKMLNDLAVEHGELIRSIYRLPTGVEIYVTTEEDRESTVLELPDEAT
jgi:hypothetical protein